MVERRILTPESVNSAIAPPTGERWIADKIVRGFGLRLWSNKSGGQKAFAIRIVDSNQNKIRATFGYDNGWHTRFHFIYGRNGEEPNYGDFLEEAREWARNLIDRLKGRPTIDDECQLHRYLISNAVEKITLEEAAQSLLKGMRIAGRSAAYVDRLDKLFMSVIPSALRRTPLAKVSANKLAKTLARSEGALGNVRILRSFIGQIFQRASQFNGRFYNFSDKIAEKFVPELRQFRDVRFPELRNLTKDDFERIFITLEDEITFWQQSLCIRLFFEMGAPLSRVMSGRWSQIIDSHWYPYRPDEKEYWFESNENISDTGRRILDRIAFFSKKDFGPQRYWFPSRYGRTVEHIRSVDFVWRKTLGRCGLRYYPLREFARSYRHPNTPSYYISFLRQYGHVLRETENAAEVSKMLNLREKQLITSDSYS